MIGTLSSALVASTLLQPNLRSLIILFSFNFTKPWCFAPTPSQATPGAHEMELPSLLISWVNPFPSRVINNTVFFCNALESHECACCLLSFLYFHWLFPLLARETSSGNRSIYKSTRERVYSKGSCGRWRLHLMGSWRHSFPSNSFSAFMVPTSRNLSNDWTVFNCLAFNPIWILWFVPSSLRIKLPGFEFLNYRIEKNFLSFESSCCNVTVRST